MLVKKYSDKKYGGSNTYICINGKSAIIIDAGVCLDVFEKDLEGLTVKGVFITHAHFDHIFYLESYLKKFNTDLYISDIGYQKLYDSYKNMSFWFKSQMEEEKDISDNEKSVYKEIVLTEKFQYIPLTDNTTFNLDDFVVTAIFTPGHSSDSYTFIIDKTAFVGDLIFANGVGRTDFYDGDSKALVDSIMKLKKFTNLRTIHSGHGESVKI